MALARSDGEALFRLLERPETAPAFFERVADDVTWTVMGTHPLAGTYTSKADFIVATFERLAPLMRAGVHLTLVDLFLDGDTMIAELRAGRRRLRVPGTTTPCAGCAGSTAIRSSTCAPTLTRR